MFQNQMSLYILEQKTKELFKNEERVSETIEVYVNSPHLNYFDDENEREWQHGGHHEQRQAGEEMGEQAGPLLACCRRENDVIKYSYLLFSRQG